jgi:hypothetical protein
LTYEGFEKAPVVCKMSDGDRIVTACFIDGYKTWKRLQEILTFVDIQCGIDYPVPPKLKYGSVVYLAIATTKIIGVCVAEPLKAACKFPTTNFGEELFPESCGISRIWVPEMHRNQQEIGNYQYLAHT